MNLRGNTIVQRDAAFTPNVSAYVRAAGLVAGILVQAPWALLPFFGLATALITYTRSKQGLDGAVRT